MFRGRKKIQNTSLKTVLSPESTVFLYLIAVIPILMVAFSLDSYAQYNGECWAADYTNVFKITPSGQATQVSGFSQPLSLSVNAKDGSCWVADTDMIRVKKLSSAGQELAVIDGAANPQAFGADRESVTNPASISVDPRDGSCWVATLDKVCKFSSDAKQLLVKEGFNEPVISVNPTNGECWVADSSNARVLKLSATGGQLGVWQIEGVTQPKSLSVNPKDGTCWILDSFTHKLVKLSPEGKILVEAAAAAADSAIMSTAVSASVDGGCWVGVMIDMTNDQVLKFSGDGKQVLKVDGFVMPSGLASDPRDGGCWVADAGSMATPNSGKIVKLSSGGQQLLSIGGLNQPKAVTVAYLTQ